MEVDFERLRSLPPRLMKKVVATMDPRHPSEDFARLFAQHERRIYSYIFSLLGDWQATEDVFQDTCAVMWMKFAEFQPGTDFASWGCRIGRNKSLQYREQCARRLPFVSEDFLETVAAARESDSCDDEEWLPLLSECLDKLTPRDRDTIVQRYASDCTIREFARRVGLSVNTAYKAIGRIRKDLLHCLKRAAARREHR